LRDRAAVARQAHNLKVIGSIPVLATNVLKVVKQIKEKKSQKDFVV